MPIYKQHGAQKITENLQSSLKIRTDITDGTFTFPVTGPLSPEVVGYTLQPDQIPTQDQVNRVEAKLQAFYDGLPADERVVLTALLAQAAEAQQQLWPA